MAGSQVTVALTQIEKQRKSFQGISLTNFDNNAEPKIGAGSVVEIGDALFEFPGDESITGWAGIGNSQNVYIKLVVAGVAVTAEFTIVAPTWSTAKQGFYDGLDRYIGGLYKDAGGLYTKKYVFGKWFENNLNIKIRADGSIETLGNLIIQGTAEVIGGIRFANSGIYFLTKAMEIGDWNMDFTEYLYVAHGLTYAKILRVSATIRDDGDNTRCPINRYDSPASVGFGGVSIGGANVALYRYTGGGFDNVNYDSTPYNRGWIFIDYVP